MCDKKDNRFAVDENLPAPIYGAPIITDEGGSSSNEQFSVQEKAESDESALPQCPDDGSEEIFLAEENRIVCVYGPPPDLSDGFGGEIDFGLGIDYPNEVKPDEE